jgi:hypothetical protein
MSDGEPPIHVTLSVGQRIGLLEILVLGDTKSKCVCHGCGKTIFRLTASLKSAIKSLSYSACKKCRPKAPLGGVRFGSAVRR